MDELAQLAAEAVATPSGPVGDACRAARERMRAECWERLRDLRAHGPDPILEDEEVDVKERSD